MPRRKTNGKVGWPKGRKRGRRKSKPSLFRKGSIMNQTVTASGIGTTEKSKPSFFADNILNQQTFISGVIDNHSKTSCDYKAGFKAGYRARKYEEELGLTKE